jgi:ADP-ribose pyrophosphatase YjhB (NUDIX family)
MHQIQKNLLQRLLAKNNLKYSELTAGYDFENNIVFHLKQLLGNGHLEKTGNTYTLTADGVRAAKDEGDNLKMFFLGFVCENDGKFLLREHAEGKTKFYNLPSGKPHFGEKIENALARVFKELTGIKLLPENFKHLSLHLKTVKTSKNEILFDDAFAIYKITVSDQQAKEMKLKDSVKWFSAEEIKNLPNCWPEIDLGILKENKDPYLAYEFVSDYILG